MGDVEMNQRNVSIISSALSYLRGFFSGIWSALSSASSVMGYMFNSSELHKEITEQYPDPVSSRTEDELPSRTRGLLENNIKACSGCKECSRICPTNAIDIEVEPGPDPSKNWVSVFDIDFGKCIFCGLCVEICPTGSIVHTKEFECSVFESRGLIRKFGRGKLSPEQVAKWKRIRERGEFD